MLVWDEDGSFQSIEKCSKIHNNNVVSTSIGQKVIFKIFPRNWVSYIRLTTLYTGCVLVEYILVVTAPVHDVLPLKRAFVCHIHIIYIRGTLSGYTRRTWRSERGELTPVRTTPESTDHGMFRQYTRTVVGRHGQRPDQQRRTDSEWHVGRYCRRKLGQGAFDRRQSDRRGRNDEKLARYIFKFNIGLFF